MAGVMTQHEAQAYESPNLLFGVVAEFLDPNALMEAARLSREHGYKHMDCYTPFPVHGLSEAMGFKEFIVPIMIFCGGVVGACAGLGLQYYTSVIDYPWNVGGRPMFSWQSFIPVTYECTILLAGLTAVFGTLALCGFPKPYHPIFSAEGFERASQDRFFICLEARNKDFDAEKAYQFLKSTGAINVSYCYAEEQGDW